MPPYGEEEFVQTSTQKDSYQWNNPFGLTEEQLQKKTPALNDPHRARHVYYNIMPPPPFHNARISRHLYRRDFDEEVGWVSVKVNHVILFSE